MGFTEALENAILEQRRDGIVCPICDKTRVEHYYKKSQTCGSLDGFADKPPRGQWLYEWEEVQTGSLSIYGRLQKSNRSSDAAQIEELKSLQGPYIEFRKDGWPLCPRCGEDELWSASMQPTIENITSCLRCGWKPA